MERFGDLHHVELQAVDLDRALAEWGWLLTRLDHTEHQRWQGGASWIRGGAYVVVARAARAGSPTTATPGASTAVPRAPSSRARSA